MHIDDLPNDVLCLVLHWTIGVPDGVLRLTLNSVFDYSNDVLHEVKRNLPLLAVCQRWRHMALPMLYSTAAFMRSAMSEWGGVKSLIIKFDSSDQLGDEPVASILDGVAMEAACDAIAAAFPGVSGLCFLANGSNPDPAISKIYGRLTGVYAGRLERLEMEHPADFPRDVVFKRLKRLNVKNYYEPDDAGLVEPFDAKIKRLVIGSSAVLFPEQLAAVEFVCTYSKRYPHLNYVKHSFS
ncbi:hypothetical protein H4R18_003937 [Coemansia javaensis]|uniref:Uncharacterized protein n=1 Tax=Coemansia javaensis TaxID=2761396 RepID=A0A9W8HAU8_9FUNG|nr:hypothetical protein H4R18_003937 [Coemansia javaensis]